MKKLILLAIVVAVVLAAIVTCPDRKAHKEAVKDEVEEFVSSSLDETIDSDDIISTGLKTFGTSLASGLVQVAVSDAIDVDNYFVMSIGTIEIGDDTKILSIGLFGHVFTTFSSEDIQKAINKKITNN